MLELLNLRTHHSKKGCLAKSELYTVCFYKQSLIATAPHTVHVQGKL